MNLKELLGEDLYNQVKEKLGDKKELFVNDGTYIPKSKFDNLNEEKKKIKEQLDEANTKIEELSKVKAEDLQKEIDDWKKKYEDDTKALNENIAKREREYIVNNLIRDLNFSSESAKKAFTNELTSKDLKIEDGKLIGFDDYLSSYKKNDPKAFVEEKSKENGGIEVNSGGSHSGNPPVNQDTSLVGALHAKYDK